MIKALTFVLALLLANICSAQQGTQDYKPLRKALLQHKNNLSSAMSQSSIDNNLGLFAFGIADRKMAEFMHLADLEELDKAIIDTQAKVLIKQKLEYLRFSIKSGCRFDLNTLTAYGNNTMNAVLATEFKGLGRTLSEACEQLKG